MPGEAVALRRESSVAGEQAVVVVRATATKDLGRTYPAPGQRASPRPSRAPEGGSTLAAWRRLGPCLRRRASLARPRVRTRASFSGRCAPTRRWRSLLPRCRPARTRPGRTPSPATTRSYRLGGIFTASVANTARLSRVRFRRTRRATWCCSSSVGRMSGCALWTTAGAGSRPSKESTGAGAGLAAQASGGGSTSPRGTSPRSWPSCA
jgi:hypothetical protein